MQPRQRLNMKMIDIGVNFVDPVFRGMYQNKQRHENDYKLILKRAKQVGVEKIIITGGTVEESRLALNMARDDEIAASPSTYPELFSTVGVHPTRCHEFIQRPEAFEELVALCQDGIKDGKVVAVGECGLDYDRLEFCDKEVQKTYFEKQFELAELTRLPLFLHNRNTSGDFYEMVRKNRDRFSNGVVHSFTGTHEEAHALLDLGLYIGINGCSLKTEENLQVMQSLPLDRIMIETDAPWCDIRATHAGFSHVKSTWKAKKADKYEEGCLVKGRNEPCTIIQVLEVIAGVRDEDPSTLAEQFYQNTTQVFFSKT